MTINEFHTAFKLELDKTQSLELPAYEPEEIDYWINRAIENFVKTRYDGLNVKRESFEETQKRTYDLSTLVTMSKLDTMEIDSVPELSDLSDFYSTAGILSTIANKPQDLFLIVNEEALIYYIDSSGNDVRKHAYVKDTTLDRLSYELHNPYSEFRLHYGEAFPLRIERNNYIELISDGNYSIDGYFITYIKVPRRFNSLNTSNIASGDIEPGVKYSVSGGSIDYNGTTYANGDTFFGVQDYTDYSTVSGTPVISMVKTNTDLPLHTHEEVVKLAVKMALENIEQPRYQTYLNEVNTME